MAAIPRVFGQGLILPHARQINPPSVCFAALTEKQWPQSRITVPFVFPFLTLALVPKETQDEPNKASQPSSSRSPFCLVVICSLAGLGVLQEFPGSRELTGVAGVRHTRSRAKLVAGHYKVAEFAFHIAAKFCVDPLTFMIPVTGFFICSWRGCFHFLW